MCTLTVDDHTSKSGEKRYMLGREPILTRDGKRIVDGHGRGSYVTSAGAGAVDRQAHPDGLPPARARIGRRTVAVEYMGERYPVTVAVAGATPVSTPKISELIETLGAGMRLRLAV